MKKILLLMCAFVASLTAGAQDTNLALNKTAIATSGNAGQAVDGNVGTRWESAQSDPQTWQVDLGESKEFKSIVIVWEGAYGKTFTIEAGNDVDGDGYLTDGTKIVNIADQTLSGFPHTQVLSFTSTTARYIKFNGTARGTVYGYSFWEFGVYNNDIEATLSSLSITGSASFVSVGGNISFTAVGKDQFGGLISTEDMTWNSSNTEVGTVTDGVFTALSAGTTTITAQKDNVTSNSVELTVMEGAKIDLFTNWQYRIYPLGADTKSAGRDGMVDANDASLWELHGATETDEPSRTYETGFIADLGAIYDINTISIHFEGACSEAFTLSFAGNDGVFGNAIYNGGATGINNHTETFSNQSVTGARYVKFLSTKAATQYGVKIFDFTVVGTKTAEAATDTDTPSITAASITNPTENSLTLNITGTDDAPYILYKVEGAGVDRWFTGKPGEADSFVLGGLEEGTTYNINIIAYDAVAHGSAITSVSGATTGGVVDTTAPTNILVSSVTPSATAAVLTVSATDDVAGILTYKVYQGSTVVTSGTGVAGESATVTVNNLTAETTYVAGTYTVTATDAAGNESVAAAVPEFTTTVKPMGETVSATITSTSESENGKPLNYTWVFTQNGMDVTVTFAYANGLNQDNQGIVGFVDGFTIHDGVEASGLTYTWENCTVGQTLTAQHKWLFYGGDFYTPTFTYVVAGEDAGLVKKPADDNGINEILGTGAITPDAFKALTTAEEKAYDLRNLKVESAVALEANNANAVFIVKEDQKTNLSGTNNLLVKNGNQYEGAITIVDQFNANYFATNLPIYATTASYTRAGVAADDYVTIALPFDADVPEGFSIYTAGEADGDNNVTFTKKESQTFEASQPYVIHNTNDENTDLVVDGTVNALLNFTETTQGAMHSVFSLKTTNSSTENMYVLWGEDESEKGKIVFYAAKGVSLGAFRAYFTGNAVSSAPLLGMVDDNGTTGINSVERGALSVEGCYTLDGRRVAQPTKGLYIVNGKKVVIK